jgi:kynurenine formamidase
VTESAGTQLPSNWGRWGAGDELGTLNLITDEVRAKAVAEVRTGRTVPLSYPIPTSPLSAGPSAPAGVPSTAAFQVGMFTGLDPVGMAEMIMMIPHSIGITHLDAPVHIPVEGKVYPGRPLTDSGGPAGFTHGSTAIFGRGVVTRGVFLDLAPDSSLPEGHGVTGAELDAAAERAGLRVRAGDVLVVRGGWELASGRGRGRPGMTVDAVRWMHRHDVAVYAGDIGDAHPPVDPIETSPLHRVGLARLGMPLIDMVDPTELAVACREEGRHSFLLVAAPPRFTAASGVPVNPIAIF